MNRKFVIFFLVLLFIFAKDVKAFSSSLYFNPSSLSLTKNEVQKVNIVLNPYGELVVGVDLVIKFDPNFIEIKDIEDQKVFPLSTFKEVNNQNGIAKVAFSNNQGEFISREKVIATLVLESKEKTGNTNISFDFERGDTKDTNVAGEHGVDLLNSVNSLDIKISESSSKEDEVASLEERVLAKEDSDISLDENLLGESNSVQENSQASRFTGVSESKDDKKPDKFNYFYLLGFGLVIVAITFSILYLKKGS